MLRNVDMFIWERAVTNVSSAAVDGGGGFRLREADELTGETRLGLTDEDGLLVEKVPEYLDPSMRASSKILTPKKFPISNVPPIQLLAGSVF